MAPFITFVLNQIASSYIYGCTAITNPKDFPGRYPILNLMSYDGALKGKFEKYGNSLIQKMPRPCQAAAEKVLGDLRENEVFLTNYMYGNIPGGSALKRVNDYLFKGTRFNLKAIADEIQLNPFDIINNKMYTTISNVLNPLVQRTELVTSPLSKSISTFAMRYCVETNSSIINLQPIKPMVSEILNANFNVRYPALEKHLDPVFCKLGKSYAKELMALSIKPVAKEFNMEPLKFVTEKSYQNTITATLFGLFNSLRGLLSNQNNPPKFRGI